jgi:DNA-binding transcriptional LysR family regulator
MKFSLRGLRYFVTTAEEGSVTAAARRLYVSQPSVSAAIAQLEAAFDQQLFIRKPAHGVILTPAGHQLLPEARILLAHAEEFQTMAGTLDAELSGRIRVACFTNLAPAYFAALLGRFQSRYPAVEVEFHDGDQAEILDGVRTARFELALTFDLQPLDDFDVVELAQIPPHAVLSESHPLARQSAVSLRALASEPLILMDMPHSREYLLSLFQQLQIRPNLRYLPVSFEMVRALAGNGLGYGLLNLVPRSSVTYDGTAVRSLPLVEPVRPLRLAVVRLPQMPVRRVAHAFVDFARDYFAAAVPPHE